MKDINDVAAINGLTIESIQRLEATSTEMQLDREEIRYENAMKGLQCLKRIHRNVLASMNPEDMLKQFDFNAKDLEAMGWAWHFHANEMTPLLFQMNLPGIKTRVLQLERTIKRVSKGHKQQILMEREADKRRHQPQRGMPNERVLDMLEYKSDGKPYASRLNMQRVLENDPRYFGQIKFCELDGRVHYKQKPVDDIEEARIGSWVADTYGFELKTDSHIGKIMALIADDHKYHPVQDYLENLPAWDQVPRLKNLLSDYFQSPDADGHYIVDAKGNYADYSCFGIEGKASIVQVYGIRFMIAAVARAMEPGVKVDSLLCLIGPQGIGKSSSIEKLAVHRDWFQDSPFDMKSKDAYIQLQGKWIVELPECETLNKSGSNTAKSFLSSRVDRFRGVHRRHATDVKRTSIMVATTNQNRLSFLNDVSGHRRYWVCRIDRCKEKDLVNDLKQLWAEAKYYYGSAVNEQHWLTVLEEIQREKLNENYRYVDTWEEEICQWILDHYIEVLPDHIHKKKNKGPGFTIKAVLKGLNINGRDQNKQALERAANVLTRVGAIRWGRKKVGKAYARLWYVPPDVFSNLCYAFYDGIRVNKKTGEETWEDQFLLDYINDPDME